MLVAQSCARDAPLLALYAGVRFYWSANATNVRRFTPVVLVNEPVLDQQQPSQPGQGVDFFCQVFRRRTEAIGATHLIPEALVRQLAYYSGGRVRDFVASVRDLALLAHQDSLTEATPGAVEQVLEAA